MHLVEPLRIDEVLRPDEEQQLPVVEFSNALAYYDSFRRASLPANLLQAQRDYFGAHTYQRIDKPLEKKFHSEWLDLRRQPKV